MKTIYYNPDLEKKEYSDTPKDGFIKLDIPDSNAELEDKIKIIEDKIKIIEDKIK